MTTTEKIIRKMDEKKESIKIYSGKTPEERIELLYAKIDLKNKSRVLSQVIK